MNSEIARLNGVIASAQSTLSSLQATAAEQQRLLVDLAPPPDATAQRYIDSIRAEAAETAKQVGNTQSAIATAQASLAVYTQRQAQLQALLSDMANP